MELVQTYDFDTISEAIERFISHVQESDLIFDSNNLLELGITDTEQLKKAIERARLTCSFAGLDLNYHFRPYYIDCQGELLQVWRLSKTAFALSFLKSDVYDEKSAQLQQIIASKLSEQFFFKEFFNEGTARENIKYQATY